MKILIFSDTHLTPRFNEALYDKLEQLIRSADKVIINGDFWDGDLTTFEAFVNSPWQKLFPLLKEKHTIYLYGNHDPKIKSDRRVNLFSDQQPDKYLLPVGDKELYIIHGHQIVEHINFVHTLVDKIFILGLLYRAFVFIAMHTLGEKFLYLYQNMNNMMAEWAQKNLEPDQILVCGHSHLAQFTPEKQFIDLGCNWYNIFNHMIVEGEEMKQVKSRY